MQNRVGRATSRSDRGDRIVQRFAGDDLAGANIVSQQLHDALAAIVGGFFFARIGRGDFIRAHRRNSQEGDGGGHGVRGVLAAAGAGSGTGAIFEFAQLLLGHFSGGAGADGFEDILNRDGTAFEGAGLNRTAVERQGRDVQPRQSHDRARNGFVASANRHHRVKGVGAHKQFDRIGNYFARNQRSLHAFGAHGDAVGNGDSVELDWSAAGSANSGLHMFGQLAQMKIAGRHFSPGVGARDERAREIRVGEAGSLQHGAGRSARYTLLDGVTLHFESLLGSKRSAAL